MLVLDVPREVPQRGLQDVRRRGAPGRNAEASLIKQESGLRLRAGEAELPRVRRAAPRSPVLPEEAKALGDALVVEPLHFQGPTAPDRIQPLGPHELHRSGAVFPDVGDQREGAPCRDLEPLSPAAKHDLVVRQEPPEEG